MAICVNAAVLRLEKRLSPRPRFAQLFIVAPANVQNQEFLNVAVVQNEPFPAFSIAQSCHERPPETTSLCITYSSQQPPLLSPARQACNPFITALLHKIKPDIFPRPLLVTHVLFLALFLPSSIVQSHLPKPNPSAPPLYHSPLTQPQLRLFPRPLPMAHDPPETLL